MARCGVLRSDEAVRICAIGSALFLACLMAGATVAEQENSLSPTFIVVFELKTIQQGAPTVRINCVVTALTEGEASIKAFKYLSENVFQGAIDKVVFLEAGKR